MMHIQPNFTPLKWHAHRPQPSPSSQPSFGSQQPAGVDKLQVAMYGVGFLATLMGVGIGFSAPNLSLAERVLFAGGGIGAAAMTGIVAVDDIARTKQQRELALNGEAGSLNSLA